MHGADLWSLILGALLGFGASIIGLRLRRNWERFDDDQGQCRDELIELARSCERARIAVRHARIRERAIASGQVGPERWEDVLKSHAEVGQTVFEVTSRVRRLRPGELRIACAGLVHMLEAFCWNLDGAPTTAELDDAALRVQLLIQAAIERVETRRASTFAITGSTLTCPPPPYSTLLPGPRS